jgi:8-oxo-dGTP diphosphatase
MGKIKPGPVLTTDIIIYNNKKEILLTRRGIYPFRGYWVLPGGHVDSGELVKKTAVREVKEETGLKVKLVNSLGIYDDPEGDPRHHTVSVVYLAKILSGELRINKEVLEFGWFSLNKLPKKIGFNHRQMINDFKKWKKKS